jgi:transcriptional regulator with XRE-family HTH domain
MDIFCTRLRAQREQRGWNQSELARHAGVPSQVISRLESGARAGLTLEVARRLARALGVSLDTLAGTWEDVTEPGVESPPPAPAAGGLGVAAPRRGRPRRTATPAATG